MKRIQLCVFIILGFHVLQAQNPIAEITAIEKAPLSEIRDYRNADSANDVVRNVMHYNLDISAFESSNRNPNSSLKFTIPTLDGDKTLVLEPTEILTKDYKLSSDKGDELSTAKSKQFYKGYLENDAKAKATMVLTSSDLFVMIYDKDGTYQINKIDDKENVYAGYYSKDMLHQNPIGCQTDTQINEKEINAEEQTGQRSGPLECVEIYLEIDYKSFQENSNSISNTEDWALAIMAQVAMFYSESGIPIKVSEIKIYTSTDPYAVHSTTSDMLYAFRDSMNTQGFNGRLAHLLSGRNAGGGVAFLNVLCSNYNNQGVSANLSPGGTTYNTYVWNINVIAHELGHNFGSNHTHDCVWDTDGDPGTPKAQIDDCGNVYDPESAGNCYDSNNKILPGNQGTIMSYCHAAGGGSVNLNLGFHPLVREHIYSRFINTNCGGEEDCSGIPPANDFCKNAISLTPTINCSPITFDNDNVTNSTTFPAISCGNGSSVMDVWFSVKIPSNGKLTIKTSQITGGISDPIMEMYEGSCENLVSIQCDDNSGINNHALIQINDLNLASEEVFIRIVEKNGNEGSFGICTYSSDLPCRPEVDSLLSFYQSMGGLNWTNKTGWEDGASGNDCDYCNWEGVTCDQSENIVQLSLNGNNLSGSMNNSLDQLSDLFYLNISNNNITGVLPDIWHSFGDMTYLNIKNNNFSGELPYSLNTLTNIGYINASDNGFSGPLPEHFGSLTNLQYLNLSNNDLAGCFPFNYVFLCSRNYINISGNTNLPNNGATNLLCSSYEGADYDKDGHCRDINDCNDFNKDIYDDAPELCDGIDNNCDGFIDENLDHGPNVWVGPASDGSWMDDNSWSKGHSPEACEDIAVGMGGNSIVIDHSGGQGQGNGINQTMRSLCIGPNTSLDFGESSSISLKGLGYILNQGTLDVNGYINITNIDENHDGIVNTGVINIFDRKSIYIQGSGKNGIHNKPGGVINNAGYLDIDGNHPINGEYGIKNESIINNSGNISIYGLINNAHLYLAPSSQLYSIGENASINLSNFEGEGN